MDANQSRALTNAMTASPTLHQLLADQQELHPILPPLSVAAIARMGEEEAARYVNARAELIALSRERPLSHAWEPPIWQQIDLEVAKKRIQHPGRVLPVFITGGMRPGKSFSCARRVTSHWLYTKRASVFALAETVATSRKLQQKPIEFFLPDEVSPEDGKRKAKDTLSGGKHERFKFSGGHFTNEEFSLKVPVLDEDGREYLGGGDFGFRFFSQDIGTFQGYELTSAWSDELVPLSHVKAVRERMATRANDTRKRDFLDYIKVIIHTLEQGKALTVRQLGLLYHGVHLISFTPYLGWNETVNYFLNGAVKYGWEIAPDLKDKPGVLDPRVPRFAQPLDPTALVAYVFTSDNKIQPAYEALSADLKNASEQEVRIKLYGDVTRDQQAVFSSFGPDNLCEWQDIPRENITLYEVLDFGKTKPPALQWWIADSIGRLWCAQEWPCPGIGIMKDGRIIDPGDWAVPSESGRMNGDEGPAYRLRLNWASVRVVREIWAMRARLVQMMKTTGSDYQGELRADKLEWKQVLKDAGAELEGPFALPFMTIPDPRGTKESVEGATLGRKYEECENGIALQPWELDGQTIVNAPSDDEGVKLILDALSEQVYGAPRIRVNKECMNTRFMFATYTLPLFKEGTVKKDEACVEWFDTMKYLLKWEPGHVDTSAEWIIDDGRR